jgi:RNA polymerase sigma factor (sigma-70 family)
MTESAGTDGDDADVVQLMREGSQDALRSVFKKYAPLVKGYLFKHFGQGLREPEIDEVLNDAACKLWQTIKDYNPSKSTLRAWFIRIAHSAAVDELRKARRRRTSELPADVAFRPLGAKEQTEDGAETKAERRLRLMQHVITNELTGKMRAVAMADLVAGGSADRKELAAQLSIPVTQVDVTRTQYRKRVRELVFRLEQENARAGKS